MTTAETLTLLPFMILLGGAFGVYLVCQFTRLGNKGEAILTSAILFAVICALILQGSILMNLPITQGLRIELLKSQEFNLLPSLVGVFVLTIACSIGIFLCFYSGEYLTRDPRYLLYYPLILVLFFGLLGMFYARDLFTVFILAEITTITASGLTAFRFDQEAAIKAGFKYLVMSSLGTLIILLGIYFIYRETGTIDLESVAGLKGPILRLGAGCFVLGFSIKAGVVPLHGWVPEVYANAPSAIGGLFAGVTSKSMLFLLPEICLPLGITPAELGTYLIVFSCANMLVGSVQQSLQENLRRFLAYSAITHTGYLMFILGISLMFEQEQAMMTALFSFLSIAIMKSLGFLSVGMFEYRLGINTKKEINGVSHSMPFNTLCFSVALAGLAGIPLWPGFIGKWLIYSAAILSGDPFVWIGLIIFLISTIISLIAYVSVLIKQYFPNNQKEMSFQKTDTTPHPISWMKVPVAILAISVIVIGLFPSLLLDSLAKIAERISF